jgi:hypothetical protein
MKGDQHKFMLKLRKESKKLRKKLRKKCGKFGRNSCQQGVKDQLPNTLLTTGETSSALLVPGMC